MTAEAWRGLADSWRSEAIVLRRRGALCNGAALLDDCAAALENAAHEADSELLTFAEASRDCGYSTQHLRRLVRQGRLKDRAAEGPTLLRRADLPRKLNGRAPAFGGGA